MSDKLKSNKILGLETLMDAGYNVPEFTVIPDFKELDIDYCALNQLFQIDLLLNIIKNRLNLIGDSFYGYSLRSASFDEDLVDSSSAGRFTSFNALKTINEIYHAAICIWKHHRKNSSSGVLCPLILQKTHRSFYSGVFFRESTDNGDVCVVESYYGSCRTIVDGTVIPYRSVYSSGKWEHEFNETKQFCYKFYSHKALFENYNETFTVGKLLKPEFSPFPQQVRKYADTGLDELLVYGYRPSSPPEWYMDKICRTLFDVSCKFPIDKGVDIEWGTDPDGSLVLYQLRALTRPLFISSRIHLEETKFSGSELKSAYYGIPASPGKCRGVITRNLRNLNENSILMLEDAQISEVHYIENIKGVVAAMGGMLSHLAIVCRELNKPFVVSILEMIPDGVYVEMDADKGCITVLESNIK